MGGAAVAATRTDPTTQAVGRLLRQDSPYRRPKILVQPLAAGDFHVAVVEAEEVEGGGVDVGNVVPVFHGVEAELVGCAMDDATFDAAAG